MNCSVCSSSAATCHTTGRMPSPSVKRVPKPKALSVPLEDMTDSSTSPSPPRPPILQGPRPGWPGRVRSRLVPSGRSTHLPLSQAASAVTCAPQVSRPAMSFHGPDLTGPTSGCPATAGGLLHCRTIANHREPSLDRVIGDAANFESHLYNAIFHRAYR